MASPGFRGFGEYASAGQVNPWLQLNWATAQSINTVTLFDRANGSDNINGGTLTFSDGSTVAVTGIPTDGSAKVVTFPTKLTTSVRFQAAGGTGPNNGLAEIEASYTPPPNLARQATASASSVFDGRYVAAYATDGPIGDPGAGDWASLGEIHPWFQLNWASAVTINSIALYDRPNLGDNATSGTLTFSDGSTLAVTGIPTDGAAKVITFPEKTVTSVKFDATGGIGSNVGLAEVQVFRQ